MKQYEFPIDSYQELWVSKLIRSKRDVIFLLMRSMKIMLLPEIPAPGAVGSMVLQVDKMSRLFFVLKDKIFSINFPFVVIDDDGILTFRSIHHSAINSMVTSQVISLLELDNVFENIDVLHFAEPISDLCEYDEDLWCLFRELLMQEDGYIRYDYDPKQSNGHLHPLHHLDVFYTSGSTFKLGLKRNVSLENFSDVLNRNTNCHYVTPAI